MNAILLWLALLSPGEDPQMLEADFNSAPTALAIAAGDFKFEDGAAVSSQGRLQTRNPVSGDLALSVVVRAAQPGSKLSVSLGGESMLLRLCLDESLLATLERKGEILRSQSLPDLPALPCRLQLLNRAGALELRLNGSAILDWQQQRPLAGGIVGVEVTGGEIEIDQISIERLSWWGDTVRFDDDGLDRITGFLALPKEAFSLTGPAPTLIDPIFRISVRGETRPLVVRFCGVRPGAEEIPLLDQALALATIRPFLVVRVSQGEPDNLIPVEAEGPFGPYHLDRSPALVEVDALLGIVSEWPTLTLWDILEERDRILDRTVPGGPMGRGIWAEVSEESVKLRLTLDIPGRETVAHELVLIRK